MEFQDTESSNASRVNFRGTEDQGAGNRTNDESSSFSLDIKTVANSIDSIIKKNTDKKQDEKKQNVKTVVNLSDTTHHINKQQSDSLTKNAHFNVLLDDTKTEKLTDKGFDSIVPTTLTEDVHASLHSKAMEVDMMVHNKDTPDGLSDCSCDTNTETTTTVIVMNKESKFNARSKPDPSLLRFPCHQCDVAFQWPSQLTKHIQIKHEGRYPYYCDICHKPFDRSSSLKDHALVHTDERPFKCQLCDKTFKMNGNLKKHIREIHSGTNLKFQCEYCMKLFNTKEKLTSHFIVHSEEKALECEVCGKKFHRKNNLKEHRVIHQTEKKFECSECGMCFNRKYSLKIHARNHLDIKPYACDFCPKSFSQMHALKSHLRLHTGERPFQCKFCDRAFVQLGTLQVHEKRHTGEKNFMCGICGQSFVIKRRLTEHVRLHTGEKPFQCQLCPYRAAISSGLRLHMKTHERQMKRQAELDNMNGEHIRKLNMRNIKLKANKNRIRKLEANSAKDEVRPADTVVHDDLIKAVVDLPIKAENIKKEMDTVPGQDTKDFEEVAKDVLNKNIGELLGSLDDAFLKKKIDAIAKDLAERYTRGIQQARELQASVDKPHISNQIPKEAPTVVTPQESHQEAKQAVIIAKPQVSNQHVRKETILPKSQVISEHISEVTEVAKQIFQQSKETRPVNIVNVVETCLKDNNLAASYLNAGYQNTLHIKSDVLESSQSLKQKNKQSISNTENFTTLKALLRNKKVPIIHRVNVLPKPGHPENVQLLAHIKEKSFTLETQNGIGYQTSSLQKEYEKYARITHLATSSYGKTITEPHTGLLNTVYNNSPK